MDIVTAENARGFIARWTLVVSALFILLASDATGRSIDIELDGNPVRIEAYRVDGRDYVSLQGLFAALAAPMRWDGTTGHLRVELDGQIWSFWCNSAIVGRDDDAIMLAGPVRLIDHSAAASVDAIVTLLNNHSHRRLYWEGDRLDIRGGQYNVTGFAVQNRENGTLIEIDLAEPLPVEWSRSEGNWINISLYDARVDVDAMKLSGRDPVLREVRTHQFDGSAQLSFRLRQSYSTCFVNTEEHPPRLTIMIRDGNAEVEGLDDPVEPIGGRRSRDPLNVIVIDPGHGGIDSGATVHGSRWTEKDVALSVALFLRERLENDDRFRVVMTRWDDASVPMQQRMAGANDDRGDLFVSIHVDRSSDPNTSGTQTMFWGRAGNVDAVATAERENYDPADAAQLAGNGASASLPALTAPTYQQASADLAQSIQNALERELKLPGRGVDQADLTMLSGLQMPSVAVFLGFLGNRQDENQLRRESYHRDAAEAICRGILDYIAHTELEP